MLHWQVQVAAAEAQEAEAYPPIQWDFHYAT